MDLTPARIAALASALTALTGYAWLRSKTPDLRGDLHFIRYLITAVRRMKGFVAVNKLIPDWWDELCQRNPDLVCMDFVDPPTKLTFKQVDTESNRVANWAIAADVKAGDVIALMLDNSPRYPLTWLGFSKAGATTALINSHLKGVPLVKTLQSSNAKFYVIGADLMDKVVEAFRESNVPLNGIKIFVTHGSYPGFPSWDPLVQDSAIYPVSKSHRAGVSVQDSVVFIYTSGTTGLPKAAHFSHVRFMGAAYAFQFATGITPQDVLYSPLPLYHSAGGVLGVGVAWLTGCPLVTRKKFSTNAFWTDVVEHKVTVVQYIGELARYLVTAPPHPDESRHQVRVAFGNGMRPEVWKQFSARFKIPHVAEFYAATEGNASMLNYYNKIGAIGRMTDLMAMFYPLKIVKFDIESEMPIRGADGLCIPCQPGEVGELLGKIENDNPLRRFQGYTDKAATEKKIARNVIVKGDEYFRTGDLVMRDKDGFVYFIDRIGDTFRWKGENVSTAEVSSVLSECPGVLEANVYGVKVFEMDGRAGMALMIIDPAKFNWENFFAHCKKNLPGYASPMFIRLGQEMELTGTLKQRKVELVKEGFDPNVITDELYYRDDHAGKFVKLDRALFEKLRQPKSKL